MKTGRIALLLVVLMTVFLVTACSSESASSTVAPSTGSQDGAALVQERCTACHALSRVESKKLTSAEWETIVDKMIGKGAELSADEKILVVNYLAANFGQ